MMVSIWTPVKQPLDAQMDTPQDRLKQERQRLGLSQEEFARLGGVQKRAQINYEKGERKPDTDYLAAVAAGGVDVRYVITGQRMTSSEHELDRRVKAVFDATQRTMQIPGLSTEQQLQVQTAIFDASVKALAPDEQELIHHYRAANPAVRPAIIAASASLAGHPHAQAPPTEKSQQGARVQQNFHAEVGQVAGHNIVNKSGRKR
jgi:transcriptional regulator with XRE-family HTH domain